MSGISSMLCIALYRDAPSHNEPKIEMGELPLGTHLSRKAVPFSFSSLREESWSAWMDAQYAAHFAHAYDPWVLDAGLHATSPEGVTRCRSGTVSPTRFLRDFRRGAAPRA